jgi:hypothetical protein
MPIPTGNSQGRLALILASTTAALKVFVHSYEVAAGRMSRTGGGAGGGALGGRRAPGYTFSTNKVSKA